MKVLAINGSPRKQWNTAMLLNKALEGAASQGAETENWSTSTTSISRAVRAASPAG